MTVEYKETFDLEPEQVAGLYVDAGWTAYTENLDSLLAGINSSLKVIAAFQADILIGLIRVVGDGQTIIYIQDLLVLEEHQGRGIGSKLLQLIFEKYKNVRQVILLTMVEDKTVDFYQKNGMIDVTSVGCTAFQRK